MSNFPPGFELVEARHIDALTEALHVNARLLTQQAARDQQQAARDTLILEALQRIAENTANLPALMEALSRNSNGHGRTDDNVDAG